MSLPLRVTVSPDRVDAAPGESRTVEVTVRNTSDVVDHYVIDTLGLPEGAEARGEPTVVKLRPGETGSASIRLTLRTDPPAAAGAYILGVLVRSRYRQEVSRCEELPLTVSTVENVVVHVEPELVTGRGSAHYLVAVSNAGNTPVRLRLTSTDPERRVMSTFEPSTMDLPPGGAARVGLAVRAPRPWSKEKHRALTVTASGVGATGKATATFVQRPRFASRLARVAGSLGAVLVLAGAVVAAALIVDPGESEQKQPNPIEAASGGTVPTGGAVGPTMAPPVATSAPPVVPPPTAGPTTAPSVSPTVGGPAGSPRVIDLTAASARNGGGLVASDAFRAQGITLSGLPDRDGPPECAGATAVAVRGDATSGWFLTGALPDNLALCNQVPVQIRFVEPAAEVTVTLHGRDPRRLEVSYEDLSRGVEDDLTAADDGRRGGIDFVLVRGIPAGPANAAPSAALRTVRFTPAAT